MSTNGYSAAVFTTRTSSSTLYARVNRNGSVTDTSLGAIPSGFHIYRVEPIATGFQFYIDGVLKTTIARTLPTGTQSRIVLASQNGTPVLQADWVRAASYPTSGTFTSIVFDAGKVAAWLLATYSASLPSGTSLIIETRTGDTATPDGSWSAWSALGTGGAINSPPGRYFQYRLRFASSDTTHTPVVYNISFMWK
jgi:hypothetical protein